MAGQNIVVGTMGANLAMNGLYNVPSWSYEDFI